MSVSSQEATTTPRPDPRGIRLSSPLDKKISTRDRLRALRNFGLGLITVGGVGVAAKLVDEALEVRVPNIAPGASEATTPPTEPPVNGALSGLSQENATANLNKQDIETPFNKIQVRGIKIRFGAEELMNRTANQASILFPNPEVEYRLVNPNDSAQPSVKARGGVITEASNVRKILFDGKLESLQMVAFPTVEQNKVAVQLTQTDANGDKQTVPYPIELDFSYPILYDNTRVVRAYAEKDPETGEDIVDQNTLLAMQKLAEIFDQYSFIDPDTVPTRAYAYAIGETSNAPDNTVGEYSFRDVDLSDYYNARDRRAVVPLEYFKNKTVERLWEMVLFYQLAHRMNPLNPQAKQALDELVSIYNRAEEDASLSEFDAYRTDGLDISPKQDDAFFNFFNIKTYPEGKELEAFDFFRNTHPAYSVENLLVGAMMIRRFVNPDTRKERFLSLDDSRKESVRQVFNYTGGLLESNNPNFPLSQLLPHTA